MDWQLPGNQNEGRGGNFGIDWGNNNINPQTNEIASGNMFGGTELTSTKPNFLSGMFDQNGPTQVNGVNDSPGMFGSFFNKTGADGKSFGGWGMDAFNIAKGAFDVYGNMQQLGLAKDALAFQKESFNKNYEAQRKLTQADLDWRTSARNARSAGPDEKRVIV